MSRAALWKQQAKVREREDRATSLFEQALEEGRHRAQRNAGRSPSSSTLPLWGPDDGTFHFHPILHQNTLGSNYFQRCCENLRDWNSIVDEIYEQDLQHLQPFTDYSGNKSPSTAFCLLLRLLLLRMTKRELQDTLDHVDSPYIRAIGFLYLRYSCPPDLVLEWITPYMLDEQEVRVEMGYTAGASIGGRGGAAGKKGTSNAIQTLGGFVRMLFGGGEQSQNREYYGTPLPRYPTAVEREIRVQVLHYDRIYQRALRHASDVTRMAREFVVGRNVLALYGDDDNPVEWYPAVIDRVIRQDPATGRQLLHPKFVVTFPEYGNTESVTLGELDVLGDTNGNSCRRDEPAAGSAPLSGYRDRPDPPHRRGYHNDYDDRGRPPPCHYPFPRGSDGGGGSSPSWNHRPPRCESTTSLYQEVLRQEQESAATSDRAGYARRRPPTSKEALSAVSHHTVRDHEADKGGTGSRAPRRQHDRDTERTTTRSRHDGDNDPSEPRKHPTPDELNARDEKKRRLLAMYG
jgi:pre-mRNA-splicing factor 38B